MLSNPPERLQYTTKTSYVALLCISTISRLVRPASITLYKQHSTHNKRGADFWSESNCTHFATPRSTSKPTLYVPAKSNRTPTENDHKRRSARPRTYPCPCSRPRGDNNPILKNITRSSAKPAINKPPQQINNSFRVTATATANLHSAQLP